MSAQSTASASSRAWIDIDLGALLRNAQAVARHSRVPVLPMVKADAYGLGAVAVVRALEAVDPWGYGVATVEEGEELRGAGISRPILLVAPIAGEAHFARLRAARITPSFGEAASMVAWHRSGGGQWHLSIDTGMHRTGERWDNMTCITDIIAACPPAGAFTHYHSAELDNGTLEEQAQRFRDALGALPVKPAVLHAENSAAIERASPSPWSIVRPGVFLYGVASGGRISPEPVVSFRTRVVETHDLKPGDSVSYDATWRAERATRVATLSVGYADGYRRSLGNAGTVLIGGRGARIVGTVTMDMTMVDVTDAPCRIGDVATLIGRDGDRSVTVQDVGRTCALSPYEILTGLRARAERRYVG